MIQKVVVNGASGVLGSQIALQTAVGGCDVVAYCMNDKEVAKAKDKMAQHAKHYDKESAKGFTTAQAEKAIQDITFTTDLKEAVKDADLIIEAIVEDLEIKKSVFRELASMEIPKKTIFVTNSSSLRPSDFMKETGRTDRFLALHYMNRIWNHNVAEVMPTSETSEDVVKEVYDFAARVGMDPVLIKKEKPGYIMNSLLIPFLDRGQYYWGLGEATPWDVDRAWMKATGSPRGPFGTLDVIGFETPLHIGQQRVAAGGLPQSDIKSREYVHQFLVDMIAMERFGVLTGEGFYHHANGKPEFMQEDFLADTPDISLKDFGQTTGDQKKDKAIKLFSIVLCGLLSGALELYAGDYAKRDAIDKVWTKKPLTAVRVPSP